MLYFSKSKRCEFKLCPEASRFYRYKSRVLKMVATAKARFAKVNEVGDFAVRP